MNEASLQRTEMFEERRHLDGMHARKMRAIPGYFRRRILVNETINLIQNRRSVRTFSDKPIDRETTDTILHAAMRAPTAGNMMLYSIIEVVEQDIKEKLAKSCDNQPFIAQASLLLLFLADYQRWFDFFIASDVMACCEAEGLPLRYPGEGDLLLACCDALIAAQTAVIAAESLGIGSCYIGDIMEQYEYHKALFDLPQYVFPVALLCFGYPRETASSPQPSPRFAPSYIHFENKYRRLDDDALTEMFAPRERRHYPGVARNFGQYVYARKFSADFAVEMTRSVRKALETWIGEHA